MKKYELELNKVFLKKVEAIIREKKDILILLLNSLEYILLNIEEPKGIYENKMIVNISKMSRIVFIIENKMFSINFPFIVSEVENKKITIKTINSRIEISQELILYLRMVIDAKILEKNCYLEKADILARSIKNIEKEELTLTILNDILLSESGYIRYDYDLKHQSAIHPLHHYDVFYSNTSTFKLKLDKKISDNKFLDLMDNETIPHEVI